MTDLIAEWPAGNALPIKIGDNELSEVRCDAITWIAALKGKSNALSQVLFAETGLAMPDANMSIAGSAGRSISFAPGETIFIGKKVAAAPGVTVDQTDAWGVLRLRGAGARDVLSRLTPLDIRDIAFPVDAAARTMLGHLTATLVRTDADAYDILVFRSMTATAIHDLTRAMEGVAARGFL